MTKYVISNYHVHVCLEVKLLCKINHKYMKINKYGIVYPVMQLHCKHKNNDIWNSWKECMKYMDI